MRQTHYAQLRITLAVGWWALGLMTWLVQWRVLQPTFGLLPLAISTVLALAISVALRLPIVSRLLRTNDSEKRQVWLICLGANINWLGVLILSSGIAWGFILIAGSGLLVEWLFYGLTEDGRAFWRSFSISPIDDGYTSDKQASHDRNPVGRITNAIQELCSTSVDSGTESRDAAELGGLNLSTPHIRRTMQDGTDEDGHRYLSGEILVDWRSEQRNQNLTVGFVPAFTQVPSVELETDADQCEVRCTHCTQSGMRLNLRRKGQLNEAQVNLAWYAIQDQNSQLDDGLPKNASSLA